MVLEVLPALWRFYEMDDCYFQYDNAPCHVVASVKQWYQDLDVNYLPCPAYILNLNPTEHLWDELESHLETGEPCVKYTAELVISLPQ